ncbi:inhibitor of pro-sigmaK processing BofA [Bacillus sp. JCM 19046]|uniref:Inhibitor of the pro-sigma K processing machinery n=1 Tax=Shouchella xiaoxiensis TaxID=766895 RepID=A0ABS2T0B9_9BACI|nr:pro-sigmaK processing inhibitor BofA family protein [Shouchella xiaoxiensis]MBM7841237.1 inhibitor of the pro-sigma K processing machinery [Shouchella xiaoxiensis]GAF15334.1 inhibitor of pro-sigmaK processing BofA [Bacillus sp. JCM 19045]GAF19840.1 inhibitor of pro-sigmaK processing BofA [Bacillus sp. JCM 19046]
MEPWLIVLLFLSVVVLLLLVGASAKPFRLAGQLGVRLVIGALLLFLLNSFTTMTSLFIPINIVTTSVVAVLGLPGMALLLAIQEFIL